MSRINKLGILGREIQIKTSCTSVKEAELLRLEVRSHVQLIIPCIFPSTRIHRKSKSSSLAKLSRCKLQPMLLYPLKFFFLVETKHFNKIIPKGSHCKIFLGPSTDSNIRLKYFCRSVFCKDSESVIKFS